MHVAANGDLVIIIYNVQTSYLFIEFCFVTFRTHWCSLRLMPQSIWMICGAEMGHTCTFTSQNLKRYYQMIIIIIVTIMSSQYVCTFILHNIYMCTHYILFTMDGIIQARCRQRGHFTPLEIVLPPPPELGLNDELALSQQLHSTVS